ncbi:MAG: thioredoxin family protein [Burkholderiaceae bacterium]
MQSNPKYATVKIIRVDWDEFGKSEIVAQLKIPRRSTLVMFNKGKEVARAVAQTRKDQIEKLFKAAT